ncbi:hypothetical protein GF339_20250 [candidate division KSB3 bacterium]|uniref:Uncharacterized protein n=1 Tax=candidate division KSB3 bacterium TaxID=2044937 RepID=A0A9D5JZE9_9BACT|nr:hypothetical protein [candidate division KSB3 bacterium]MBD3326928.1 hypothetical protein [candidate division KSB3 bacterium]
MFVGHVARVLEHAGIATVITAVRAFQRRLEKMIPPRLVLTPHVMGRPVGAPGDQTSQRNVLLTALHLLRNAEQAGAITHASTPYRPQRR